MLTLPFLRTVRPRVSLVTGGASGIGLALSRALLQRGGTVVIADVDELAAQRAAGDLGAGAVAMALDVTDREAVRATVDAVLAEYGSLDLLANNAGAGMGGDVEELTDRHWDRALTLNLGGVVYGVRAAYPVMVRQGSGVILNTASLAGLMPVPSMLPYTTTKWGVVGLSLGLRAEAAPKGSRSTSCVRPSSTPHCSTTSSSPLPRSGSTPRRGCGPCNAGSSRPTRLRPPRCGGSTPTRRSSPWAPWPSWDGGPPGSRPS